MGACEEHRDTANIFTHRRCETPKNELVRLRGVGVLVLVMPEDSSHAEQHGEQHAELVRDIV